MLPGKWTMTAMDNFPKQPTVAPAPFDVRNSFRCHTYATRVCKCFTCHTYETLAKMYQNTRL
jgi:hypothetical protein